MSPGPCYGGAFLFAALPAVTSDLVTLSHGLISCVLFAIQHTLSLSITTRNQNTVRNDAFLNLHFLNALFVGDSVGWMEEYAK